MYSTESFYAQLTLKVCSEKDSSCVHKRIYSISKVTIIFGIVKYRG